MTDIDLAAYKSLYLNTARDNVSILKKNLEILNKNSTDKNAIYEVFRMFHSLKSQNFFMGYQQTAQLCKLFEDYFRNINDAKKILSKEMLNITNEVITKLENSLDEIEKNNQEKNLETDITNYENKIISL